MKRALLNNKEIDAGDAAELSTDELAKVRSLFRCFDCKAPAFYNKGWENQDPYFGSRHHSDNCTEQYIGPNGSDRELVQADTVVIDMGNNIEASTEQSKAANVGQQRTKTSLSGSGTGKFVTRRKLNRILNELIVNPNFSNSKKIIVVEEERLPASDFFVPFNELDDRHINRTIGLWGDVFQFNVKTAIVFLNRADARVDIRIPKALFEELQKIYNFAALKENRSAKFLLVGKFDFQLQHKLSDLRYIALQFPRK